MGIKKYIPNTITLLNLSCGTLAVIYGLKGWQSFAIYLILIAAIFDFLDGFAARLLKAYSPIGKELDSLADLISFGLAPSILIYYRYSGFLASYSNDKLPVVFLGILAFTPLVITLASALRLAIFNVDTRQTTSFIGVPTPANAILIAMFTHYTLYNSSLDFLYNNLLFYPIVSLVLSYLLVSNIPMFSLKFKSLKYSNNKTIYHFGILAILLLIPVVILKAEWSLWLFLVLFVYLLFNIALYLKEIIFDSGSKSQ